jgi:hypothetical protein
MLQDEAGGYRISGTVRSPQDLDHLKQRLTALNPQAALGWEVGIEGP